MGQRYGVKSSMNKSLPVVLTQWALRITLAAAFLSAVADRFGWWGPPGGANIAWGAWQPFVDSTAKLVNFLPTNLVTTAAIVATAAEIILSVWLLVGWRLHIAAYASAGLLLLFALCMTFGLGVKAPLNFSVFTAAAAALALATLEPKSKPH